MHKSCLPEGGQGVEYQNQQHPSALWTNRPSRTGGAPGGRTWVYDRIGAADSDDEDDDLIRKHALWDVKYIGRLFGFENIEYTPAWQQLGEVKMAPGRLISFLNAFQRRMGP